MKRTMFVTAGLAVLVLIVGGSAAEATVIVLQP